jgi:putative acetyltransferase
MPLLSLVAFHDDQPVGHILFTKTSIIPADIPVSAVILAPLGVIPEMQFQGVVDNLIEEGLKLLSESKA